MKSTAYPLVWSNQNTSRRFIANLTCFGGGLSYSTEMPDILEGHVCCHDDHVRIELCVTQTDMGFPASCETSQWIALYYCQSCYR